VFLTVNLPKTATVFFKIRARAVCVVGRTLKLPRTPSRGIPFPEFSHTHYYCLERSETQITPWLSVG
jgi:hypothetical protein